MSFIYDMSDSWSNAGTTFTAIKMNVTNTASAAGSKLIDLQIGGASLFNVDKNGNVGLGTATPSSYTSAGATKASLVTKADSLASIINCVGSDGTSNVGFYSGINAADNPAIIYRPNLRFGSTTSANGVTGFSERMRLDASGNLGLGTASPAFKLDIVSSGAVVARVRNSSSSADAYLQAQNTVGTGLFGVNATGQYMYTASSIPILFYTTAAERMRITDAGNVGIGTSAPGYRLEAYRAGAASIVAARSDTQAVLRAEAGSVAVDVNVTTSIGEVRTATNHPLLFSTNSTERMRIDASGNLGIGVTPAAWTANSRAIQLGVWSAFYQNASGYPEMSFNSYQSGGSTWTYLTSGNPATRFLQDAGAFKFFTAASGTAGNAISFTQTMTLDSEGRLGIGTTAPSERLHLNSASTVQVATRYNNPNTAGITVGAAADGSAFVYQASAKPFIVYTNATERARIDSSGNFLVGTTNLVTASQAGVRVGPTGFIEISRGSGTTSWDAMSFINGNSTVGTITTNGTATSYNTSSDYRLKEIDGPIVNSGAYIDALKPVQGSWKADGSRFIGLLAHEVQEVSETQIATGEKDGEEMQAMDYSAPEIIANLIAEIQSLRARVAQLEGE